MNPLDNGRALFRMEEDPRDDDAVRLVLLGELDLAVAPAFAQRIAELRERNVPVQIDLSRLEFLDSTGLRELIVAITEARQAGWALNVAPGLHGEVERIIDLVGARQFLWPEDQPAAPRGSAPPQRSSG